MNPFVAYMQYLASVEEDAAARRSIHSPASNAHGVPPGEAHELDGSASSPCSPLVMSSPSLPQELLDFSTQDSSHPEAPALSALFQPSGSALPNMSPGLEHYQLTFAHFKQQPPSEACAPSFESTVYTLADEALNLTPTRLLKERAPLEVLEQAFSLLTDAREAVTLRSSIVLTEIGFQLEEIRTKLRIYDSDVQTLAACVLLALRSDRNTTSTVAVSADTTVSVSQRKYVEIPIAQGQLTISNTTKEITAMYYHPYHLPPLGDNTSSDVVTDIATATCVHDIYVEQNSGFAFETIPPQPERKNYEFMTEYPTNPHPNAPHPYPVHLVFNEGTGHPTRNIYELHGHWRHVLDTMTIIVAYQQVTICRPVFETAFSNFVSGDPYDIVTIKEVWSLLSLLLDVVLESVCTKFLSGESSTHSASQHAEQILVGIGFSVKPFLDLYMGIYRSAIFSHLIGRLNMVNIPICLFATMDEIVNDVGGLYLYYLVRDFVTLAQDTIISRIEQDTLRVFGHHDICTLRFPDALDYHMLSLSQLHSIAFNPLISALFLAGTVEKTLDSLELADYVIVAPARNRLYCCAGVHKLTQSLFNTITSDVVIHAYFKRHGHMVLTAEIFGFASTVVMFHLQSIRTGLLAGRTHPIVDPAFRIRGVNGQFTPIFLTVWGVHSETLRGFGMMESSASLPGIDFPFTAAVPATGSLAPVGLHTPSPIIRRQRSMVNLVSDSLGYFNRSPSDKSSPRAGATASASGSPLPFSAATRPPTTPHSLVRSVKSSLQDFVNTSGLKVDSTFSDGSSRFPLLHAMALQRAKKLSQM
ncbi:hypothetical protein HYPSUDRAFT_199270 [Hypholoma sublateritium FD-334 SS-4]|uniref:Uncharacterized protein n=1 Tax=Hypholoma sublateritium (strain FD-334 SS-4) TaxID=945553 RepID=A0A0D2P553_HYPSF|nr:hypothetical protein HYPSUDRAFT_199270 [Hypholoma sublateritium FD-334 SS-4]